jgi:predicted nucleotidyltransferase
MGGGGLNSGYTFSSDIADKILKIQYQDNARFLSDINDLISALLAEMNARDADLANERLDKLAEILGDSIEIEAIRLGGSVAKSTSVEGISDLDALVVLTQEEATSASPREFRELFYNMLNDRLRRSEIEKIKQGVLAVTITYKDGMEIQLLPAFKNGKGLMIDSGDGDNWLSINPKMFMKKLTAANKKMGGALIPSIKLMKSIMSGLPKAKQMSGYHIEALAIEASASFKKGQSKVPREVLLHLISYASSNVLKPIPDITGQSRLVDSYLGRQGSIERRNVSQALSGVYRRLDAATTEEEWRKVLNA